MPISRKKAPSFSSGRGKARATARAKGFRSKFELDLDTNLKLRGLKSKVKYENLSIKYVKQPSTYTPDFMLQNGIIIEAKGLFHDSDRAKHLYVKKQHPELDIRFVFQNPDLKLSKASKTTYADWCEKHGFKWAKSTIPTEWFNEPGQLDIVQKYLKTKATIKKTT